MSRTFLIATSAALALVVPSQAALSAVLTFQLSGVTFEDGGRASGFFQYLGPWDINVTGGDESLFPTHRFTPNNSAVLPAENFVGQTIFLGAKGTRHALRLHFPKPAGDAESGASLPLIPGSLVNGSEEFASDGAVRNIVSGEIHVVLSQSVPEPSTKTFAYLALVLAAGIMAVRKVTFHRLRFRKCRLPIRPS